MAGKSILSLDGPLSCQCPYIVQQSQYILLLHEVYSHVLGELERE